MNILRTEIETAAPDLIFSVIDPSSAVAMWPDISHFADDALEFAFDGMKAEDVLSWIVSGRLVLVVLTRDQEIIASMTLEIVERDHEKICHCLTFAGDDLESWIDQWLDIWETIARELGCQKITIKGREGWARYARRLGFQHMYTSMFRDLREVH